jgi:hypothetical protein
MKKPMNIEYVGIAAQTLMGDGDTDANIFLEVMIPELVPTAKGDVNNTTDEEVISSTVNNSAPSGKKSSHVKISETIKCEYMGHRSNGSIPNIHLGEQVIVYQIGYTDRYYWKEMGRDDSIRTTEHLKLRIANKTKTVEDLNDENTYFIEMDTREGKRGIHISTSKGTGEKCEYDIKINTDDSTVEIKDDIGNSCKLSSKDHRWLMKNASGSSFDMHKEDATLITPKTVKVISPEVTINAEKSVLVNSPLTTINGHLLLTGLFTTNGAYPGSDSGNACISGNIKIEGNETIEGTSHIQGTLQVDGHATFNGGTSGDRT